MRNYGNLLETCPCSSLYFFETIVTGGIFIQMSSSLNPVAFYTAFRPVAYFRHSSSRPHIPFLPACGRGGGLFQMQITPKGSLSGPIWRPSNGTCGPPDTSCRLMGAADVSACLFVFGADKKRWDYTVFCSAAQAESTSLTHTHTHTICQSSQRWFVISSGSENV